MFLNTKKTRSSQSATRNSSHGFTLVEMLISMAVTLVMMAAVVSLFANIGEGIRNRNAGIEMGGQIRLARAQMFKDLAGATSPARPKLPSDDHDDGYLEIIEGRWSDKNPSRLIDGIFVASRNPELNYETSIIPGSNIGPEDGTDARGLGDYDDILALTVRSDSEPFKGHGVNERIESNEAEVIWYAVENPADESLGEPGMRTVYRRVLLIAPWVGPIDLTAIATPSGTPIAADDANRFFQRFDISAHFDPTSGFWIPNTLSDLTKRENRFAHLFNLSVNRGFPHALRAENIRIAPQTNNSPLHPFGAPYVVLDSTFGDPNRIGEDVMLNDVLAFDLRVFDSEAQLLDIGGTGNIVGPSDAGWRHNYDIGRNPIVGAGAFVDLNYGDQYLQYANLIKMPSAPVSTDLVPTQFSGPASAKSRLFLSAPFGGVYDTWPYHYENDGINQDAGRDNNMGTDQGTNGIDNAVPYDHDNNPLTAMVTPATGVNGVDDSGERETAPPYDVALRAMQVKLRIYDRDTRQIREATVTRSFVPQ